MNWQELRFLAYNWTLPIIVMVGGFIWWRKTSPREVVIVGIRQNGEFRELLLSGEKTLKVDNDWGSMLEEFRYRNCHGNEIRFESWRIVIVRPAGHKNRRGHVKTKLYRMVEIRV